MKILGNPNSLNNSPPVLIMSKKKLVYLRPHIILCNTSFNIILPSTTRPCEWFLSFWIPHQTPVLPYALPISYYDLNIRVSHTRIRYIRASECDPDASRRSKLHLNMRQFSITIDHSDPNVQQTKLSAEAGVAMLNVLHIGKGASHWNGNCGGGGGDFLIARYTVLYTYCFFRTSTLIPFYSPLTLPSSLFTYVSCRKQWGQKASGSTRKPSRLPPPVTEIPVSKLTVVSHHSAFKFSILKRKLKSYRNNQQNATV
jgi:hypothetical protein